MKCNHVVVVFVVLVHVGIKYDVLMCTRSLSQSGLGPAPDSMGARFKLIDNRAQLFDCGSQLQFD